MKNTVGMTCFAGLAALLVASLSGAAPTKDLNGSAAGALAPGESLLLAGFSYGSIEPVAIRGANGRYRELPSAKALDALAAQHFKQGQTFALFKQGVKSADFTTTGFSTEGCFGFGIVTGELRPDFGAQPPYRSFVSFGAGFPGQRSYPGQSSVAAGDAPKALLLARSLLQAKGLGPRDLARLKLGPLTALKLGLGQKPALSFRAGIPLVDHTADCDGISLAVLAENDGSQLIPRIQIFRRGNAESQGCAQIHDLISSFQAEPGSEYLLYEGQGDESNWYEIYQRSSQGGYSKVFTGGGGAC